MEAASLHQHDKISLSRFKASRAGFHAVAGRRHRVTRPEATLRHEANPLPSTATVTAASRPFYTAFLKFGIQTRVAKHWNVPMFVHQES